MVIDNTDILDQIMIPATRCAAFQLAYKSSALWDGIIGIDILQDDGTYREEFTFGGGAAEMGDASAIYSLGTFAPNLYRYPYTIRVRVDTQATIGNVTVYLVTQPAPANPLF